MHLKRMICSLAVVAFLLGAVYTVSAQPQSPYPIGEITMESTQIAAGLGITWGHGTLKYGGKVYQFKAKGLDAGAVGISKVRAEGGVYNMTDVSQFAGHYVAATAGAAVIKGPKGLLMRNAKGVVINLKATQTGLQLSLGAQGLDISMK